MSDRESVEQPRFRPAKQELQQVHEEIHTPQTASPAYRLAFLSVGIITLFSALVFRRLDAERLNPKSVKRAAVPAP